MNRLRSIPLFFCCVALAAAQSPADSESQIRSLRARSNRALAKHDKAAFAATLAPDFVIVRGNGAFMNRQDSIDTLAADFNKPDAVRYERTPDKIEISSVAPLAAEHGHWIAVLPSGRTAYSGTYLAMWRRTESGWQIRSELFVLLGCGDQAACAGYRK